MSDILASGCMSVCVFHVPRCMYVECCLTSKLLVVLSTSIFWDRRVLGLQHLPSFYVDSWDLNSLICLSNQHPTQRAPLLPALWPFGTLGNVLIRSGIGIAVTSSITHAFVLGTVSLLVALPCRRAWKFLVKLGDGSAARSACCSCRGPEFCFWHPPIVALGLSS